MQNLIKCNRTSYRRLRFIFQSLLFINSISLFRMHKRNLYFCSHQGEINDSVWHSDWNEMNTKWQGVIFVTRKLNAKTHTQCADRKNSDQLFICHSIIVSVCCSAAVSCILDIRYASLPIAIARWKLIMSLRMMAVFFRMGIAIENPLIFDIVMGAICKERHLD